MGAGVVMANPVPVTYNAAASPVAGGRFVLSEFWRNLAPGWLNLTPPSSLSAPYLIRAFSGFSVDPIAGKLYIFGGGHNDYWGNEVWEYDLETRTSMSKHYEPDVGQYTTREQIAPLIDNTNYPGAFVFPGGVLRPISRHTYGSHAWLDDVRKFLINGNSTYQGPNGLWLQDGGPYPMDAKDQWLYDPAAKTWEYLGSDYNGVSVNRLQGVNRFHRGIKELVNVSKSGGNVLVRTWNSITHVMTVRANIPVSNFSNVLLANDHHSTKSYLLVIDINSANPLRTYSYDHDTGIATLMSVSGDVPTSYSNNYPSADFSTKTGLVHLMHNSTGGRRTLDPATGVWTHYNDVPASILSTFNNWHYDNRRGVFFLIGQGGVGLNVFAFKE